jgi:transposase-like protein
MAIPATSVGTELINDEHKRDTRGRHIAEPRRRAEIIAGFANSGLTQKAYARQAGVNYHTLVAWLGRSRRESVAAAPPCQPATPSTPRFAQLSWPPPLAPASASAARLEVVLPDGIALRGDDPAALLVLLHALTPYRPC